MNVNLHRSDLVWLLDLLDRTFDPPLQPNDYEHLVQLRRRLYQVLHGDPSLYATDDEIQWARAWYETDDLAIDDPAFASRDPAAGCWISAWVRLKNADGLVLDPTYVQTSLGPIRRADRPGFYVVAEFHADDWMQAVLAEGMTDPTLARAFFYAIVERYPQYRILLVEKQT